MTDDPSALLRPATSEDAPFLGALWAEAFPGERSARTRTAALLDDADPYGGLDDARIAEEGGRRIGGVRLYRLRLHLRGRTYPTLGLGAVAVVPEHRGRGLGRRICMEAMRIGRERGDALSLLFPFRVDYYARLGYALVGERHRYRFRTADLTRVREGTGRVIRLDEGEWEEPAEVYGRVARRSSGMLERQPRHWRRLEGDGRERFLHRDGSGSARGYLVVEPGREAEGGGDGGGDGRGSGAAPGGGSSAEASGRIRIVELVAEDAEAREALLGVLARAGEGGTEAEHDAFPSERLHRLLPHPVRTAVPGGRGLWFESAGLLRGPMMRILHPGRLATGGGEVAVDDAVLPENRGRWSGGSRRAEDPGPSAVGAAAAAARLAAGTLPGIPPPPEGWDPLPGAEEFRLLDEF